MEPKKYPYRPAQQKANDPMSEESLEDLQYKIADSYGLDEEDTELLDGLAPDLMVSVAQRISRTARPYFSARAETNRHTI